MKKRVLNEIKMILFTAVLGAIAGALVWGFLRLLSICTKALWVDIPSNIDFSWYPLILCTVGGLIIGILHHFLGDYPEELPVVMGKIKKTGSYPYKHMPALLILAFLPLLFAGSVGPEAGLTGIIAGLCSWVGDNIKYAKKEKDRYSEIGEAITLGVIFHAPLFGILAVEEPGSSEEREKAGSVWYRHRRRFRSYRAFASLFRCSSGGIAEDEVHCACVAGLCIDALVYSGGVDTVSLL